ncbi:MAG: hypothetical protein LC749_08050 [Actinobacteria bacterium]|nr:hypothetical protein [Actinomycetota bacterium]
MAEWSYTRRYVTGARAALCEGKLIALANSDPTAGVPGPLSPMPGLSRERLRIG